MLFVVWRVFAGGGSSSETHYVHSRPVVFNFHYPDAMHPVAPRSPEIIRVERRRGSLFLDSFAVEPLSLPPFRGDVSGELPVYAEREIAALRKRFPRDFELTREGKARVNAVPGYDVQFRARLGERRLFGRLVLLPEPAAGEDLADPTGELENARSRRRRAAVDARHAGVRRGAPARRGRARQSQDAVPLVPVRERGPMTIDFDQFLAVDMRVGRVLAVDEFPEARKPAWKLTIDFGPEVGIKRSSAQITNYAPG